MMDREIIWTINTNALFQAINDQRKRNGLTTIHNPLLASKLSILFALKANKYVNFKNESVELCDTHLTILHEILSQHFNVDIASEIRALSISKAQEEQKKQTTRHTTVISTKVDILGKVKGFLKIKPRIQAEIEIVSENTLHIVNTLALFSALNNCRKNNHLNEIENPLIASKLSILFALKTKVYINFRNEFVELQESHITTLQEILEQHFSAEMTAEIRTFIFHRYSSAEEHTKHHSFAASHLKVGVFNKIKGFLRSKADAQENHA